MRISAEVEASVAVADETAGVPRKPCLTLLLKCSLVFWLSSFIAYSVGLHQGAAACSYFSIGCFLASLALVAVLAFGCMDRARIFLLLSISFLAGAALALCESVEMHSSLNDSFEASMPAKLTLKEDLVAFGDSCNVLASVTSDTGRRYLVQVSFDDDPGLLLVGETIESSVSFQRLSEHDDYSWSRGFALESTVYSFEQVAPAGLRGVILSARRETVELFGRYGGNQAGILQALVCGYRGGIEKTGEYEDYKIIGLAHVIAVSGSHLALIALVANAVAKAVGIPARMRIVVVVSLIAMYFVFSGCTISALRAAIMASTSMMSLFATRRSSAQNALGVCLLGFIVVDPKSAVSVSLALSAGSTLGLILFTQLIKHWFGDVGKLVGGLVVEPVALTLASGMTTQLYSIALFSQLSVISVFANLVAAPLFSLGCVVGLLSALISVIFEPLAPALISLSAVLLTPLQLACAFLSSIPWACVPVVLPEGASIAMTIGICSMMYRIWPDRRQIVRFAFALAMIVVLALGGRYVWLLHQDELIMLDVGQGDAFVLRSAGASVLIDTGNRSALLRDALGRNWVLRLDSVLVTHADDDHCGSLVDLSYMLPVSQVGASAFAFDCNCEQCSELRIDIEDMRGSPVQRQLNPGDILRIGGFSLEVVWPYGYSNSGGNEDSLCLLVEHVSTGSKLLLTGDAESEQLKEIIRRENLEGIDVLKLGHHGSEGSVCEETLSILSPKVSLISVGEGNRYGHPSDEVLGLLERASAFVFRTDENGDVIVRFTEDGLRVRTQK